MRLADSVALATVEQAYTTGRLGFFVNEAVTANSDIPLVFLAEMRDVAEQYVRVRSAATLLQWAIDCYRGEKQAPPLKRAGEFFATLTGGSFSDLSLEFDEDNNALAGLRPGGGSVAFERLRARDRTQASWQRGCG